MTGQVSIIIIIIVCTREKTLCLCMVLGIDTRASHMLGKYALPLSVPSWLMVLEAGKYKAEGLPSGQGLLAAP